MTDFIKYNPTTGEILFSGSVPESMINAQGDCVLKSSGESSTHYVDVAARKVIEKPRKPSDFHRWDYAAKKWIVDTETAWLEVRNKRNALLAECDWIDTVSAQSRIPENTMAAWIEYRQKLRDVTKQNDPLNIDWPVP